MTTRRAKIDLIEVRGPAELEPLADLIADDPAGMAEFGGFYGHAPARLAPLLSADRRVWLLRIGGELGGFLDAEQHDDDVSLSYFVAERFRRRGVASGAIGRILGMAPWPNVRVYSAAVDPRNLASREVLRAVGFGLVGVNDDGDLIWQRTPPRPRAVGAARFLDDTGRIEQYPVRTTERAELLALVADRVLPRGGVWTEPEVNLLLEPVAPGADVAVLRRYLVDAGMLERTRSGSSYSRADDSGV